MVLKYGAQRVAVLIDAQNLYHSAKNLYQARVNFKEVLKKAVAGRALVRAFAYVIRTKSGEERGFVEALKKIGIEIREKELQEYPGGFKKGDWDVGITVDAIRVAPSVDVIVLASGDGDFLQLVEFLKNQGKRVEVIAFSRTASSKLKEVADEFFDLETDPAKYLLKMKNESRRKKI